MGADRRPACRKSGRCGGRPVPARCSGRSRRGAWRSLAPRARVLELGSIIEPAIEYPFRIYVHCGIEWLGTFNDIAWRTDVPDDVDFVPSEWESSVDDGYADVTLVLSTRPEPVIEATANGHTVTYRPTSAEPPGCR